MPNQTRFYYPDNQVICQPVLGTQRFHDAPTVVAEVLSESTRRTDTGEKKDAYLNIPSLKVLLLVESEEKSVVVYRRSTGGEFAVEA
ncbi:MAG: Uma2 family endonuclease, partial [Verrucomicrobiaceae bacterium]